jgi:hypothetical protein
MRILKKRTAMLAGVIAPPLHQRLDLCPEGVVARRAEPSLQASQAQSAGRGRDLAGLRTPSQLFGTGSDEMGSGSLKEQQEGGGRRG